MTSPVQAVGPGGAADHFELTGRELKLTYTANVRTTSGAGERLVVEYAPLGETRTFGKGEIEKTASRIGELLTVTLSAIPDDNTLTLSLLLPTVNMGGKPVQRFKTAAILTTIRTAFVPQTLVGALQAYKVVSLTGRALPNPF